MKRNSDYRIIYHRPDGKTIARYPKTDADDSPDVLSEKLDELVHSGKATGGDIEEYIPGFSWCLLTPQG